ncbi:response regulator, partial [Desulfovibrio sp. OttesenSCG-928-A18]|nr:response regulator [Desulfovibrio sp. OttesenSCG-928-A18]
MSRKLPFSAAGDTRHRPEPKAGQLRVPGFAAFQWDIIKDSILYSEEWTAITQSEYDPDFTGNQDWWAERVSPTDLDRIHQARHAMRAGLLDACEIVYQLRRADGEWRTLLSRAAVTRKTAQGAPALADGICVDITDVLRDDNIPPGGSQPEIDLHPMLENSPDLFIRFDRELKPVYVNPALNRYLDGLNRLPDGSVHLTGGYKEIFRRHVGRVFAEKTALREELRFSVSNGGEMVGDCSFWPEFDDKGHIRYTMAQVRDITEQRAMEGRAMLDDQRIKALYELTMMESASEHEVLRFVMDTVLALSGSESGFIFIPSGDDNDRGCMFWSDDHYRNLDSELLPGDYLPEDLIVQMGGSTGREGRRYRSINNGDGVNPLYVVFNNKMRVMRGIIAPAMEEGRVVCVAGVCNRPTNYSESDLRELETFINSAWLILRRRRFIRELQEAKEAAEAANKAKNTFLASVSHELRTPLNGVLAMMQLLEGMPLEEEHRVYLQTGQSSGRTLLRIISDILDYSSMEAGKMSLALEPFDCRTAIASALDLFAREAEAKGLDFSCHIDPELPPRLLGDPARLEQILFNLVGNAIKFTSTGSVRVRCQAAPQARRHRCGLAISVKDTGIGIPRDKLANIFDAFSQVDSPGHRRYAGTGLGLSIVRRLSDMMQGSVSIDSELGKGTEVRCLLFFELPPDEASVPDFEQLPGETAAAPEPLDILVAEDDSVGRMAVRAFIARRGHRVFCVEDGVEALEALQLHQFDCLFSDISMPRLDGMELLEHIRSGKVAAFPPSEAMRQRI